MNKNYFQSKQIKKHERNKAKKKKKDQLFTKCWHESHDPDHSEKNRISDHAHIGGKRIFQLFGGTLIAFVGTISNAVESNSGRNV